MLCTWFVANVKRKWLEQNYSTVEKECLGLVCALKHFDVYLVDRHFKIIVDHCTLQFINTMKDSNPRLTCWALAVTLQQFPCVEHNWSLHSLAIFLAQHSTMPLSEVSIWRMKGLSSSGQARMSLLHSSCLSVW
jgi:hypothetical protein